MNSPRFLFVLVEPPKLESQGDGRRLALEVIRKIRDAGKKGCSAHLEDRKPRRRQCDALLAALIQLETEGTSQARAGFVVVLTDLLGRALSRTLVPELFEDRERQCLFMRWRGESPEGGQPEPASPGALGGQNQQTRV